MARVCNYTASQFDPMHDVAPHTAIPEAVLRTILLRAIIREFSSFP